MKNNMLTPKTKEEDVYGQVHPIETNVFVSEKLAAFQEELGKIPRHEKEEVCAAEVKCPKLLTADFKLMFLRCEVFNVDVSCYKSFVHPWPCMHAVVSKPESYLNPHFSSIITYRIQLAVKRYITYWEKRVELFGPEKAFQPLTQNAALKDDAAALHNGFLRLVGTKGIGGRHILFCDSGLQDLSLSRDSAMRAFWYLFHIVLEDEDTQKRGIVFICDLFGSSLGKCDLKLYRGMAGYAQGCLPSK